MGLFNSTVLEWAIGIVFVYMLLAIICTTINEWVASGFGFRAKDLQKAIVQLLDGQPLRNDTASFLEKFYAHPLIAGMKNPDKSGSAAHPQYLQSRQFATTVMDLATTGKEGAITFDDLQNGVKNGLPDGKVRTALLALLQNADGKLNVAQRNIERWFDDTMERASGWYKHRAQKITIVVAALLTICTNADTVRIGHILWTDGTLRSMIVEQAKARTESGAPSAPRVSYPDNNKPLSPVHEASRAELDKLSLLLGWSGENIKDPLGWPARILGWFLTTAAISLGAPFWFDLLNKFVNLRNAGKKPESTSDSGGGSPSASPTPTPAPAKAGG